MKKIVVFILLTLILQSASAQRNAYPGYIVFNNGDTVKGYIDYKVWDRNPRKISFREVNSSGFQELSLAQLALFDITGHDRYIKAIVTKDMVPTRLNELQIVGYKHKVQDTVFLRELGKGDWLTLYELVDSKVHYYLQEEEGQPQELIYNTFLSKDATSRIVRDHTFRNQLKKLMSFYNEALIEKIDKAAYKEKDLKDILIALDSTVPVVKGRTEKLSSEKTIHPYIGAGVVYSSFGFTNEASLSNLEAASPSYSLAAGMNLTHRRLGHVFITIGAMYSTYTHKSQKEEVIPYTPGHIGRTEYNLKMNNLAMGLMFNYKYYQQPSTKAYLGLGMNFNVSSYPVNQLTKTNLSTGTVRTNEPQTFQNKWIDFTGKGGVMYKNFDFSLYRRLFGTLTADNNYGIQFSSTGLQVAYTFNH